MNSSNESIPHLDFDLFSKDKSLLAKGTINALHNYGFCVFSNHTIDKDLISNCLNMFYEKTQKATKNKKNKKVNSVLVKSWVWSLPECLH